MGRFCVNCGAEIRNEAVFCGNCGNPVANQSHNSGPAARHHMSGRVGFSERINHPEVIKELEERKKKGNGCIVIGILLPFIIYLIVSFTSEEVSTKDALVFGGGISLVLLLLFLFASYLSNAKRGWDGIVIDKQMKNKSRRFRDGCVENYIRYTVYFRTDSGKKEYSVTNSNDGPDYRDYYDYLNVGDRVRYYPQLSFRYEKYDKSKDREIPCMFCKTMNNIQNDRCEACNNLLFK